MPDAPDDRSGNVRVAIAPGIDDDSWLHRGDAEFEDFKAGYAYARNQTMAIPSLAKLTPEEAYWVWATIQHGVERARTHDGEPAADDLGGDDLDDVDPVPAARSGMGHCCFAGCDPRPCGCCTRLGSHHDSCEQLETLLGVDLDD